MALLNKIFKKRDKINYLEVVKTKIFQQYSELAKKVRDENDLYNLSPLEEFCNERILIGNDKEKKCIKYKILKLWDPKKQGFNLFLLYKNGSSNFEFYQFGCLEDCKNFINKKIKDEQLKNNYDKEIIGGAFEYEFMYNHDGEWFVKKEFRKNGRKKMRYKKTEEELNWCQQTTKDSSLLPMQKLHQLIAYMTQELVRLTDLNDEYESFLKEVKK